MRWMPVSVVAGVLAMSAQGGTLSFEQDTLGAPPSGWTCGATGKGSPRWTVDVDAAATNNKRVLRQSGSAPFPWCVRRDVTLADGFVEVKFRPEAGREDQAGGVVWRWQDGDNYYVARANALENNVSLYYTVGGSRKTLKYVDAPVPVKQWHTIRVEFRGAKIAVLLNGTKYIEMNDDHVKAAGAVGVWTKADSVTSFDRFTYGAAK